MFNIVEPATLVRNALNLMKSVNLSYVVVMDDDMYRGLFTERDYARNLIMQGRTSNTTTVEKVMTIDLPIVTPDTTAEQCMLLMNSHKARYLVVFDDERFVGVVTIHDLLREAISNTQTFNQDLAASLVKQEEENSRIY